MPLAMKFEHVDGLAPLVASNTAIFTPIVNASSAIWAVTVAHWVGFNVHNSPHDREYAPTQS